MYIILKFILQFIGGLDNYGADDLYNVNLDDQWNQSTKQAKVFQRLLLSLL